MSKFFSAEDHVLPRPVERLPEYANAKSRKSLAEKLGPAFGLSEQTAAVIADAVVDPTAVRKSVGEPEDPQVERIPVPGGTLLGIRTQVWARRIMPDPRNPRIGPARRHQFAVDPGSGGDDCTHRPIPEPRTPDDRPQTAPELAVDIDNRPHLEWASVQATKYIFGDNDWRLSIASQGVMEAVWLVATTFVHEDGSAPATALVTVEGSSRTTAVHDLLGVTSSAVPYDTTDAQLRKVYKNLNEEFDKGTTDGEQQVALRCERMPALILVGFRPHGTGGGRFPTAVKSFVALRHVDPPKPWGEGPENELLADEVLDELSRQNLIAPAVRSYLAGTITKSSARAAHLSDDPAVRAAKIVETFARRRKADERFHHAVRAAVTSQSTKKNVSDKLCCQLAAALAVRSMPSADKTKRDQVRRYLSQAYGKAVHEQGWECTNRDVDTLEAEALKEVRVAIADPSVTEVGPASLELAVRAAYPLIVGGFLNADRGTRGNEAGDRRNPGEVLNAMRRKGRGVRQLAQALRDFAADQPVRAVADDGAVVPRPDGSGDQLVNDVYLRGQYPPPGQAQAKSGGTQPSEVLRDRVIDFTNTMSQLEAAYRGVTEVDDGSGNPLVEADGVDAEECVRWSGVLGDILGELRVWEKRYRRKHGVSGARASNPNPNPEDDPDDAGNGADTSDEWDEVSA